MGKALRSLMPIDIPFLSEYPDFFAFAMVMLLVVLLCVGVKESSILNNIFTVINLVTIMIVIVSGAIKGKPLSCKSHDDQTVPNIHLCTNHITESKAFSFRVFPDRSLISSEKTYGSSGGIIEYILAADPSNWSIAPENIPSSVNNAGTGGFLPFGMNGVMIGAAKCFYGFVGFDSVATTGEEAKKPQRHIPLAIILSLIIIFVAYFSISTVLTMMIPYYAQVSHFPRCKIILNESAARRTRHVGGYDRFYKRRFMFRTRTLRSHMHSTRLAGPLSSGSSTWERYSRCVPVSWARCFHCRVCYMPWPAMA